MVHVNMMVASLDKVGNASAKICSYQFFVSKLPLAISSIRTELNLKSMLNTPQKLQNMKRTAAFLQDRAKRKPVHPVKHVASSA
jgi:hypothetical protein